MGGFGVAEEATDQLSEAGAAAARLAPHEELAEVDELVLEDAHQRGDAVGALDAADADRAVFAGEGAFEQHLADADRELLAHLSGGLHDSAAGDPPRAGHAAGDVEGQRAAAGAVEGLADRAVEEAGVIEIEEAAQVVDGEPAKHRAAEGAALLEQGLADRGEHDLAGAGRGASPDEDVAQPHGRS